MSKEEKQIKKGWFARLIEKLDKKLEDKSKKGSCDCDQDNKKGSSCC